MTGGHLETLLRGDGSPVGGAVWTGNALVFCRPTTNEIATWHPHTGSVSTVRRHTGGIRRLAVAPDGSLYASQGPSRRLVRLDGDGSMRVLPYRIGGEVMNFTGDLDIAGSGDVWVCTSPSGPAAPGPRIYRMQAQASIVLLRREARGQWSLWPSATGIAAPTAVQLSADEQTLYVSENDASPDGRRELRAYRVDGTVLEDFTVLHAFGADRRGVHTGLVDLCLAADGSVIGCGGDLDSGPGPMVYAFTPQGRVLATVPFPEVPTGCVFGGEDMASLYVTTQQGSLLRLRMDGWAGHRRERTQQL